MRGIAHIKKIYIEQEKTPTESKSCRISCFRCQGSYVSISNNSPQSTVLDSQPVRNKRPPVWMKDYIHA